MGTTPTPPGDNDKGPSGNEDGMVVLSYILAGIIFYGGWVGPVTISSTPRGCCRWA
ncbi:hypothetical protein G7085_19390 [Tessaracoccus sp. HDW20]|uniref:hypothetical protein n=1 Tax=Tessaracoccus coleopterorum TaxID=2714950 RepID=UPI0018D461EE|nr:hypothetical protein [Tessaracoccus coleopterorum]NHB85974.1 hypothetical protein [Tessaracoccus coleopterorum]